MYACNCFVELNCSLCVIGFGKNNERAFNECKWLFNVNGNILKFNSLNIVHSFCVTCDEVYLVCDNHLKKCCSYNEGESSIFEAININVSVIKWISFSFIGDLVLWKYIN